MADFSNIIQEINTNLPDNNTQSITAAKLRTTLVDLTNTIDTVQDDFETEVNEDVEQCREYIDDEIDALISNGITRNVFQYSTFTTATPNISNITGLNLFQVGDYVELDVIPNTGYMLWGTAPYQYPSFYYSSDTNISVRLLFSWSPINYTSTSLNRNARQKIKVELHSISGTSYTFYMYYNGNKVAEKTDTYTSSTYLIGWDQIGYNSNMVLYSIKSRSNGIDYFFDKFENMTGATGITDTYSNIQLPSYNELISDVAENTSDIENLQTNISKKMFYEWKPNSLVWNIDKELDIYQNIYSNVYLFTRLGYYSTKSQPTVSYPHGYWRLERSLIGTITDGVFTSIHQVLTAGENEFVLRWTQGSQYNATSNFTGGWHWGENLESDGCWVNIIIDGNIFDPSTANAIPITPCKSVEYKEYSVIYNCSDNSIAAWHYKNTIFKDCGYETFNDVKFVQALDYFAYYGIVCVDRWISEYAMPEKVNTITDMGSGTPLIAEQFKSNNHRIHYEGNGYACDVESEVLYGSDDSESELVVYNDTAYNKYYRKNTRTHIAGDVNNRLGSYTKVKFYVI